jgi:hypothetical protein
LNRFVQLCITLRLPIAYTAAVIMSGNVSVVNLK